MDDARVDAYARLFGVSPAVVGQVLGNSPPPAAAPPPASMGPAPGDPGFAASFLGAPSAPAPAGPPLPPSPAPGEPGFSFANVGQGQGPAAPPPPPSAPVMKVPRGAGTVDTSMVAPKGFSEGTAFMNVPKGAGQVDLSGVTPSGGQAPAGGATHEGGAPTAGGHYAPGGWRDTSRGVTTQGGLDPEAFSDSNDLYDRAAVSKLDAADHLKRAAEGQARIDEAYFAAAKDAQRQEAERQARIASERQAYIAQEHDKLNALNVAAQAHVDPEAAKGSMGAQLLAAIGIAMGQFGASLNGGTNTALQIVNANIDRRIKAQEANIGNAHKSLANAQNLYKENLEAFGDRARASAATKMQMLDQAKLMADEQFAKGPKTEEAAAKHAELLAGIQTSRAGQAQKFGEDTASRSTTTSHQSNAQGVTGSHEAKTDAHGYAQDLEKAGIPKALAGLQDIDQRLDAMGTGDIAGVGPLASHVPAMLTSKEGVANRQAIAHIKNALRKEVAGASLTPGEKAELDKDLEGAGDASSLRNFVQSYRRSLSNQQRSIGAGYSEEGRALYHSRGGPVADIRTDKGTTPYQRPVDGSRPDEPSGDKKPQYRKTR